MKVKYHSQLEDERLSFKLPGLVAQQLDEYREFLARTNQGKRERQEVVLTVLSTFLETNHDFRQWKKIKAYHEEKGRKNGKERGESRTHTEEEEPAAQ